MSTMTVKSCSKSTARAIVDEEERQTSQQVRHPFIAHARNGRISTFGLKSDVTIMFLDPDFF